MSRELVIKIIGQGKIGGKSQALIESQSSFQKANSPFPSIFPVTSGYFDEFRGRAGIDKGTDEATAKERIMKTEFMKAEKEGITDTVLPFFAQESTGSVNNAVLYAAIARSDESGVGTGIRKSKPALASNKDIFIGRLLDAIKEVLASGFSKDAKIFDRMMGIGEEANGVMLMPYYGIPEKVQGQMAVFPLFLSVIYANDKSKKTAVYSLADENRVAQWRVTSGSMFDAVCRENRVNSMNELYRDYNDSSFLIEKLRSLMGLGSEDMQLKVFKDIFGRPGLEKIMQECLEGEQVNLSQKIKQVNAALPVLFDGKGSFYAEYVINQPRGSMPVQFSKIKIDASRLEAYDYIKPLIAPGVFEAVGTCRKAVENVRFASEIPSAEDEKYNEGHSNYLLYIKTNESMRLMENWSLRHLCNAGAVYLEAQSSYGANMNFGFHLGGYFRELGIPLLVSNKPAQVKKDGKYVVQADEFSLKGLRGLILEQ